MNGVTVPTIALEGVGIQPRIQFSGYNFGLMRVGQSIQQAVPFENTGNDTLHIENASIAQPSTRFRLGAFDQAVPPGGTGTALVTYTPNQAQTDNAILELSTDDPNDLAADVPLTGQGALPQMVVPENRQTINMGQVKVNSSTTQAFFITNNGNWNLNITNTQASPEPFSVLGGQNVIAVGSTGYVTVSFAPNSTGQFQGTLVIEGDDPSNPSDTIFLTGTGIESAFSVNPVNVNFGLVPVQTTVFDTIVLTNTGSVSVNILSYSLTPQTGVFTLVNSSATQVVGNGTASVVVSFTPNATGNYSGTLTISTDADVTPTRTISLTGEGVKGTLVLPQAAYDFGSIVVNNDSTILVTLSNSGEASLTINTLMVTGSAFSDGTFSTPQTIPVGGFIPLSLTFQPSAVGIATGTVNITLGDGTQMVIALQGTGVALASVNEAATSAFAIAVSPNPANSVVSAHIEMAQTTDGTIEIFDVTGHTVLSMPLGLMTAGSYDVSLPIRDLSSGNYFVRVANSNGNAAEAKLVIER